MRVSSCLDSMALVYGTAFKTGGSYKPKFPVHAEKHRLVLLHSFKGAF